MRWKGRRQSSNIEDRRGVRISSMGSVGRGGGALRLLPIVFRFLGFKGTVVAILALVGYGYFTGDLQQFLGKELSQTSQQTSKQQTVQQSAQEKELVQFVSTILADTEDTWHSLLAKSSTSYKEPKLVLFRKAVKTGCGVGAAQMGPFYCPVDQKVYIDLSFFDELKSRHQAPGDFAQAYVIAHEIGHHVQTLTGISSQVNEAKQSLGKAGANKLSVKQELQADCYAGIWAHHANRSRQLLESGDIDEGLNAASAIGDDRLQKQAQGYVVPDLFTHGTSQQRVKWFKKGLEEGSLKGCDTFKAKEL
jgi:predicted metalloprotease